jgi:ubiquinone/menaquinone biosynthesis C-methylase UbiE
VPVPSEGSITSLSKRVTSLAARASNRLARRIVPERVRLARAWAQHPPELLDSYLVSGYQNPRINVQSILARHAIARRVLGPGVDDLEELMDEEIRFAVELNETLRVRAQELGVQISSFLDPQKHARVLEVDRTIEHREREFEARWASVLASREAPRIRVVELASGSANDYRAWADYGLAAFLDYSGVDLNPSNVDNARRRYPSVDFRVGSVMELPFPNASADLVVAADIFEHLSLASMEHALSESIRVARDGLVLTFFNMAEIPEHAERPKRMYQWNRLSRTRLEERLREAFPFVRVTAIAPWLRDSYGYAHSYNPRAYTIIATQTDLAWIAGLPLTASARAAPSVDRAPSPV